MKFYKKATGFEVSNLLLYVFISFILLFVLMFIFLFAINGFKANIVYHPSGMEEILISSRLFYSPNCFAYYDYETLRTYPLVVDLDKFTQERFETCLSTDNIVNVTIVTKDFSKSVGLENKNLGEVYEKNIYIYDFELKEGTIFIGFKE